MIRGILAFIVIAWQQSPTVSQRHADALLVTSFQAAFADYDARNGDRSKLLRRAIAVSAGRSVVATALGRAVDPREPVPGMAGVVADGPEVRVECSARQRGYPWDCQLRGADVYVRMTAVERVPNSAAFRVYVEVATRSLSDAGSMNSYTYRRDLELRNGSWYPVGQPRYLVP